VSKADEVDLTVIDNPNATPAEIIAATAAKQNAEQLASNACDQTFGFVWDILENPTFQDFENVGTVSSNWVTEFAKGAPSRHGKFVTVLGDATLTIRIEETPS
jgi:hypothetical protein